MSLIRCVTIQHFVTIHSILRYLHFTTICKFHEPYPQTIATFILNIHMNSLKTYTIYDKLYTNIISTFFIEIYPQKYVRQIIHICTMKDVLLIKQTKRGAGGRAEELY